MIKIVFSEVESPTTSEEAIDLGRSTGVRAVNTSTKPASLYIIDNGETKSITLVGGESLVMKKYTVSTVYGSSKTIRIAGVSIY